jgi:tetratricopeptide (TPR) repeat protein
LLALRRTIGSANSVSSQDISNAAVAAIPILEAAGDEAGLARAWHLSAVVHLASSWSEHSIALEQALTYAQRAGDAHEAGMITSALAIGLIFGPTPVESAIARCNEMLEHSPGPFAEAVISVALAVLHAMATRFEQARELYAQTRRLDDELGSRLGAIHHYHGAMIALLAADPATAERELRTGYEALREMGEQSLLSTLAGLLGHVLYDLQRFADADEMTAYAQEITQPDDVASNTLWRSTRAKLLARTGDHQPAILLAESALALVETTDAIGEHAGMLLDLAEVLRLADRHHEAATPIERALHLFEAKGNIAGATRARTLHAKLIPTD